MNGDLLTSDEVAGLIGVSNPTVLRLAHSGELPHIRRMPGRRGGFLFHRDAVAAYVESRAAKLLAEAEQEHQRLEAIGRAAS